MACRECSRSSHSDIPPFRELLQLHSSKSEASVTSCHVKKRSSFLRLLHVWSISGFSNGYEKGLFACFNNKSTRPAPKGSSLLILHLYMTDHVITASHFSNQQHHKMWKFTFQQPITVIWPFSMGKYILILQYCFKHSGISDYVIMSYWPSACHFYVYKLYIYCIYSQMKLLCHKKYAVHQNIYEIMNGEYVLYIEL